MEIVVILACSTDITKPRPIYQSRLQTTPIDRGRIIDVTEDEWLTRELAKAPVLTESKWRHLAQLLAQNRKVADTRSISTDAK